jgi:hypothetical protein
MTLDEAIKTIRAAVEQMDAKYGNAVFDEWAVLSTNEAGGRVLHYSGSRQEQFQKNFGTDFKALNNELANQRFGVGDFEFARHAGGTHFDAFLVLGRGLFLICNNTSASMEAITKDPRWLGAQVPFVELSETFRGSPLAVK